MIDLSKARILVTGGAGFIGSALVWELNRRGCERVVIADFLETSEKWRNLAPLAFEDYLEADDLLARMASKSLGRFDLVLHMGACSSTTERNASYLVRNNYQFTRELAGLALSSETRFVYASSAATYGDGSAGMNDDASAKYLHTLRPLNMYGYSKQMFDVYAAQRGLLNKIVGLKFFNIFGPNENHKGEMRSLVNKAFDQVAETGGIKLFKSYRAEYADGEQKRDFLYVKDAVDMTLHLAANNDASGLFNVGSGEANTWLDLANAVFAALGKSSNIQFVDMPEELRAKYQYFTQADIHRVRNTGYNDSITRLGDAVADYVKNYLIPDRHLGDT
ncbi:MAG: ADP-glyceromanno-heptose 6-epimerase [Gemmatimonadaceae bacterium]